MCSISMWSFKFVSLKLFELCSGQWFYIKGDNSKTRLCRVMILSHCTSSDCVLSMCVVSSLYPQFFLSYDPDKKTWQTDGQTDRRTNRQTDGRWRSDPYMSRLLRRRQHKKLQLLKVKINKRAIMALYRSPVPEHTCSFTNINKAGRLLNIQ